MRIASFNVNGIRAAQRRGFEQWLATSNPDVVALQEVRAQHADVPEGVYGEYHVAYEQGGRKGRNGVALLTRHAPSAVRTWSGDVMLDGEITPTEPITLARGIREFSHEGRYVEVDLADAPLTVASLYLPKGGLPAHLQKPGRMREAPDGGAKYERKMRFLDAFTRQLSRSRRAALTNGRQFLLMGDLNVAHTRYDLTNWRTSKNSEGFLPEEREWIGSQLSPRTLVDVVRKLHGEVDGPYSWWSWMGNAFDNNVGWRIDFHLATPKLAKTATAAWVDREPSRDVRISDHAPVVVDYAFG